MKKLLLLFASLFILTMIGCRKDEDPPSIVGNWQPEKYTAIAVINGQNFTQTDVFNDCQKKSRTQFKSDNTGVSTSYDDTTGTCKLDGTDNFTYTYDTGTKKLTMTTNGQTQNFTVTTLTSTDLVLKGQVTEQGVTADVELTAKRVTQ